MRQHPRWTDRKTPGLGVRPTPDSMLFRSIIPAHLHLEAPGSDGIRHGLVTHVRGLIAAGVYDTPERWADAEEAILDRYCE